MKLIMFEVDVKAKCKVLRVVQDKHGTTLKACHSENKQLLDS